MDTGVSPQYDEVKDADILKALRTNTVSDTDDISEIIKEAETLKAELDEIASKVDDKEKRLKVLNDVIKEHAISQFRDGDKKVEIPGSKYTWTVSKTETTGIDKDLLSADGLIDKYLKKTETYRMVCK